MKTLIITLALLLCSSISHAQQVDSLRNIAYQAYLDGNFQIAANAYAQVSKSLEAGVNDYYNAACSFALAGQSNMALTYLDSAFINGFGPIDHVLTDPDLESIRSSKAFQNIIDRERNWLAGEVIEMKDLLKALTERKVVFINNKKIVNEYGDWLDFDISSFRIGQLLKENAQLNLKITPDSLIDLSDRKLYFYNCYGEIHLQNLKVDHLSIRSDETQGERNSNSNNLDIVQLNRIEANSIEFLVDGYNFFRAVALKSKKTDAFGFVNVETVDISTSEFELNRRFFDVGVYANGFAIGTFESPIEQIAIKGSIIRSSEEYPSLIPFYINARQVYLAGNTIEGEFTFDESSITRLSLSNNVFKKAVDISDASISDPDLYMPFDQFKEGFGTLDRVRPWETVQDKILITGESDELEDREAYDRLVFSYKKMFDNYRLRGDLNSANACYLKLKDIMMAKDYRDFQQERTFKLWVRYQIAVLLKFYTESGTSPAKAIVMSFYIILIFSVLYLFFPSEWDPVSKKKLLERFKLFIENNSHGYFKPFLALISGLLLSWLNAFVLSLNAFVTLGFGSIPTTGAGRYICIIQGFLGWFLLSIFTVALLNQMLP